MTYDETSLRFYEFFGGVRESFSWGSRSESHLSIRLEDEKSISGRLIDATLGVYSNI